MKRNPADTLLALEHFIPPPFRTKPITFWSAVAIAMTLGCFALAPQTQSSATYLGFCLPNIVGVAAVPAVFRYTYRKFSAWARNIHRFAYVSGMKDGASETKVQAWVSNRIRFFEGSHGMYLFGVLLAVFSLYSYAIAGYPVGIESGATIFSSAALLISAFFAGVGLYALYCGFRFVRELGRFHIRVKNRSFGVVSTGRLFVECYFAIAIAWSFYFLSAVLGVQVFEWSTFFTLPPIIVLGIPSQLVVISFFVLAQFPLHRRMVEFKRSKLQEIEQLLDPLETRKSGYLTRETRDRIEFLEKERIKISSLPEWPFSYKEFFGAVGSGITVILPAWISALVPIVLRAS